MKKLKNSKIIKVLGIVVMILIILYFILLVVCRTFNYQVIGKNTDNKDVFYLNKDKKFYINSKEICSFSNKKYISKKYIMKFDIGLSISVRNALRFKLVSLKELQDKGFPCY